MKINYDRESDALYIDLSDSPVLESEEIRPGIIFDYDKHGHVVGIEILDVKDVVGHNTVVPHAAE